MTAKEDSDFILVVRLCEGDNSVQLSHQERSTEEPRHTVLPVCNSGPNPSSTPTY